MRLLLNIDPETKLRLGLKVCEALGGPVVPQHLEGLVEDLTPRIAELTPREIGVGLAESTLE